MEKIKQNLDKIIKVLSIVAMALFIPSIFGYLDENISTNNVGPIIYMTRLVLLVGASGALLFIECKRCDKYSLLPIILLSSANLLSYSYSLLTISMDFGLLPNFALYVAIIVLAVLKVKGGNILNAYLILLLIATSFAFASAIGGGASSLGLFIILGLILLKEYFCKERE